MKTSAVQYDDGRRRLSRLADMPELLATAMLAIIFIVILVIEKSVEVARITVWRIKYAIGKAGPDQRLPAAWSQ
jgi:hypothetical protein